MNSSIIVDRIGKAYRVGNSRKERFKEWFLPFYKPKTQPHWVLSDISFTIQQGEAVGIIGMNGAGKSTLLKIITGTTAPSTGSVSFHGRAAALLELGMGFHPDFTGRQNIALAGQLIGLSSEEIQLKTPAIETFAEIGEAIDEPVRTYSSGMQMRLAFALATAVRPDILIVDEALSVGDTYFQQKSFNKIREFREQGTTLLFVSHDKSAVLQLCDRAILLNHGRIQMDGAPNDVMDVYNALIAERADSGSTIRQEQQEHRLKVISGNRRVSITDVILPDEQGAPIECLQTNQHVRLVIDFKATADVPEATFGILIKERTGMEVFGTNTYLLGQKISLCSGQCGKAMFDFQAALGPGMYSITVAAHQGDTHALENFHWIDLAVTFSVVNVTLPRFTGVSWMPCSADTIIK